MFVLGMAFRKRLSGYTTWKLKAATPPKSQAGALVAVRKALRLARRPAASQVQKEGAGWGFQGSDD